MKQIKAVILSGGKGTRLKPLTDKKPKPLICVGDRPCIDIILEKLSVAGIKEACLTLGYRKDDVKRALGDMAHGIKLTYFEEDEPLGTAGGVKNCESFLDDDFIVVSGDSLCDIDFDAAIASHRMKKTLATMVLSRESEPLEYGVVLVNDDGNVSGFSEKPSWDGVKSDFVNSGIYIFEKEILSLIPENTFWDFSKNLFPKMLDMSLPINTYSNNAFWCDIGSAWALYSCNMKTLTKDFFVRYIQKNVTVEKGAFVSMSVIGQNSALLSGCEIKRAVIGRNCTIGEGAEIVGCILGDNVVVGKGVRIERGAVIGDNVYISDWRLISEGKRIPADTRLENDAGSTSFFANAHIKASGQIVISLENPENAFLLGRAVSSLSKRVGITYTDNFLSYLASNSFSLGGAFSGVECVVCGVGNEADARFGAGYFKMPFFHFSADEKNITATPFQSTSLPLSRNEERELISSFERPSSAVGTGEVKYFDGIELAEKQYFTSLFSSVSKAGGTVGIKNNTAGELFCKFAGEDHVTLSENGLKKEFFIEISPDRKSIFLHVGKKMLDTEHCHALILKSLIARGKTSFTLPDTSPVALNTLVNGYGAKVFRHSKSHTSTLTDAFSDLWARDALFGAALLYRVLDEHSFSREKLEKSIETLPAFLCVEREIDTSTSPTPALMRRLSNVVRGVSEENGFSIKNEKGEVKITPESRNKLRIIAEAQNAEFANELCDMADSLIKKCSIDL